MPNFAISPMAGNNITEVHIFPSHENDTYEPIESTLRVTNGTLTKDVTLIQHGMPCLRDMNSSMVAENIDTNNDAQNLQFVVDSDFPVCFDMTGFIEVYLYSDDDPSGRKIMPDAVVPLEDIKKTGAYIIAKIGANSGSTPRSGDLEMYHYINGQKINDKYFAITITQRQI